MIGTRRLGPMQVLRGIGLAALLLALALKALVPTGWMPGVSLAQPLVLCPDGDTGHAMSEMHMAQGSREHHQQPAAPDHPCVFAGLGAPTLPVLLDPPSPPPAPAGDDLVSNQARILAPGRGLAAPPPPSHAPPTLLA